MFGWSDLRAPTRVISGLALGAYGDLAYAVALTGAFILLRRVTRNLAWSKRLTVALFAIAALLSLLLWFVNVSAIAALGHPVNYQWLYYSNFMRSVESYTALAALLSWHWVTAAAVASLGLLIAGHLLVLVTRRILTVAVGRQAVTIAVAALLAYLGLGWFWRHAAGTTSPKVQNAVVALVGSVLYADDNPVLRRCLRGSGRKISLRPGSARQRSREPDTPRAPVVPECETSSLWSWSRLAQSTSGDSAPRIRGNPGAGSLSTLHQAIHELLRPPAFEHPLPGVAVARGLLPALLPGTHPEASRHRAPIA